MTSSNPAAAQGWVKSTDPKTGRVFYANHVTRKTQWDPPTGWVEEETAASSASAAPSTKKEDDNSPLPSNWEVMHDPTTGKPFYVDHERKITTWTRPTAEDGYNNSNKKKQVSFKPAVATPPTSGNAALARILAQQRQEYNEAATRSYEQEAQYYTRNSSASFGGNATTVDFSDALPTIDSFKVQVVPDSLRPRCAQCRTTFGSVSNRRHHCRLCGDVFCDSCSNHRVELPLEGAEYDKPVRVCDYCQADVVDKGNFFSMRRYLTPLHLYSHSIIKQSSDHIISNVSYDDLQDRISSVNSALSALHQDLKQWLQSGESINDKVTIPPHILIPNVTQYLLNGETSNYALQTLASLLALESLSTKTTFAQAVFLQQQSQSDDNENVNSSNNNDITAVSSKDVLDAILMVLERSGTDRKTLYLQEQAARILFYLSERPVLVAVGHANSDGDKPVISNLDTSRALRDLLDHTSTVQNPNLQRWSAAAIHHFISEDQRRSTEAVNQAAAELASGYDVAGSLDSLSYKSCLDECLVQTGGVMILCSLVAADDPDTRTHAVQALSTLLEATRSIQQALQTLSEMTGGAFHVGSGGDNSGSMIRALVAGGACAGPLAQLLLSADTTVATMGAKFVASLVTPLLSDPLATASLSYQYDCRNDDSVLGACREAALAVAQGPCLPALLSLLRDTRPVALRQVGLETLAAVVLAVSAMAQAWISDSHAYEEALEKAPAPLRDSLIAINDEGVMNMSLQVLQQSGSSLGVNNKKETPHSRMREAAGMILGSLTSVSAEAIMNTSTAASASSNSNDVLAQLLRASNDNTMTVASTLRGDGSPRCLGALETVANILMFAWQHPSGAASELLDRMIEVMDAGAIPYASKVLNAKMDWDSRDLAVGAMKGRTAACKLLACLFGIPLTDDTGIGMRRLMDAVDSDARSYRGGERAPSNIVEAVLSCLQTASSKAKNAMLGTLEQGPHYQAALMDLVAAALLATGSMCGSSVAPGGSEGTMIQAESFLVQRSDIYVSRRKEICSVACEVVVRGGRNSPSLLPTMLVGGFGEESVTASLRLALAVAQNGTVDQHAKLALSGILVPISDSLRSALTRGDLYKFSASLALVRFCGPHVAAGQGGGIESVRDAIRVATNVLTLPINPDASLEQLETQEALKSECIAALESLSRNASLWSAISSDALPSIVKYLQNPSLAFTTTQGVDSRVAALKAVLQIVQVPSHAVAAAENGIVDALGELLSSGDPNVAMPALQVLHVVSSNEQARYKAHLLESGLIQSVCTSLGNAARQPSTPAEVTILGLEIIANVANDVDREGTLEQILVSPKTSAFVDACCGDVQFVKVLCASLLYETRMKLRRHDDDCDGEEYFDVPDFYGESLPLLQELCNGFTDTHIAASALLFKIAVYACAIESRRSESFWRTFLVQNAPPSNDSEDCSRLAATSCAHFLLLLTKDHEAFVPSEGPRKREYVSIARPLVRHKLLQGLKDAMASLEEDKTYDNSSDPYITSLIVEFNIPHVCLSLWKDPALLDLAFELLKQIVEHDIDDTIHLFVQGKAALLSLFDLLNIDQASIETSNNVDEIRRFLATILGHLAEKGLLTQAVEKYDMRGSAIAALAAASLNETERPTDDDEDTTSHRLSSVLMQCLVELCSVKDSNGSAKHIQLSASEADELAKNVGKKICHMVLSRFLERAKLKEYEIDDDEDIMNAPDVAMLCAIAQHESALKQIQSIGGLHALSLVAAEGEVTAMVALKNACKDDASVLLEGDTFVSIMTLISREDADWREDAKIKYELESSAFELLARLASGSSKGRNAVANAEHIEECLVRAIDILTALTGQDATQKDEDNDDDDEGNDASGDDENDEPVNDASDGKDENKGPVSTDWMKPPPIATIDETSKNNAVSKEDEMLGKGACLFLSALVSTDIGRRCFGGNEGNLSSLANIINDSEDGELQYAALKLVVASSRYASTDGEISVNWLSDVLTSVLLSDRKLSVGGNINSHMIKSLAMSGILGIFDLLSEDKQLSVALAAKGAFVKIIKQSAVIRSSSKETERASSAEAAHNLLTILLVARGKAGMEAVYAQDLLTSCIQIVQWRHDPKTTVNAADKVYWDGSVTMALQLLYFTLTKPQAVLDEANIDRIALSKTTLMLARPGKAPRKAIDVRSVLERVIAMQDSSCVFAQSVSSCLFD